MIVRGPSGEKLGRWDEIEAKVVPPDMAAKTTIRWLIRSADGAPNYAMRVFEIGPGGWIKEHSHPWEHEIFVLSGNGKIKIGERWYDVGAGTFIYIPPNVPHAYENPGNDVFRFICVIPTEGEPK